MASAIYGPQPMPKRARQLPAASIGVQPWQQQVWLLQIEHVLAERKGPPKLLALEGFGAPALTQYSVTTPDLLRSFRIYNAGKPYHRQVRPFGFMVMFQQANEGDSSTVMRVIAPFNRNPVKAARKAFDRDVGALVKPSQLKTYADALRTYHNHPEAKFRNGERGDRGPTQRRHIIAQSLIHIGKEANKLEPQQMIGIDPNAQVEFLVDSAAAGRLKAIAPAVKQIGPSRVARAAGLSRKHVSAIVNGSAVATPATMSDIERGISSLQISDLNRAAEMKLALYYLRAECKRDGLRHVANRLEMNPSYVSRVLAGLRPISTSLMRKIRIGARLK